MENQTLFDSQEGDGVRALAAHDLLGRAFWATLLLTGDVARAEAAVLRAIWNSEPDPLSDETFLAEAVMAAISGGKEIGEQCARAQAILPRELRRVLCLPPGLRHCFVLRALIGFSREVSAQLLNLTAGQVDQGLRDAVLQLARLAAIESTPASNFAAETDSGVTRTATS